MEKKYHYLENEPDYAEVNALQMKWSRLRHTRGAVQRIQDEVGQGKGDCVANENITLQRLDDIPHHFGACLIFCDFKLILNIYIQETYPFSPPTFELYKKISTDCDSKNATKAGSDGYESRLIAKVNEETSASWRPSKTMMHVLNLIYLHVNTANQLSIKKNDSNDDIKVCCILFFLHHI